MTSQMNSPQPVEGFVKFFKMISTDPSFSQLKALVEENERLRDDTTKLQTAYDQNLRSLAKFQEDVKTESERTKAKTAELENSKKTIDGLKKEIAQAKSTLQEKASQLTANGELFSKLQAEVKKREAQAEDRYWALEKQKSAAAEMAEKAEHASQELEKTLRADLDDKEARLSELNKFVTKLQPQPSDAIQDRLGSIFKSSYSLIWDFLGIDLPNDVLTDSSKWNEIRDHHTVRRAIPVPSTNSSTAKQMRVAASLSILASALDDHVFQPTYLLGDNELAGLLDDLSTVDFKMEAHLRSVLLKLSPSKQKDHAAERAQKATSDLLKCVSPLLLSSKRDEFTSALLKICQNATRHWAEVQRLADRVESVFSFDVVEAHQWKLVEFPGTDNGPLKPKGAPSGKKEGSVPTKMEGKSCSGIESVVVVVWPAFVLFDEEEQEILNEGLVLENHQVEGAKAEESSEFVYGSRRMIRHHSRKNTAQNRGEAAGKKTFLSKGAGGPSGGD